MQKTMRFILGVIVQWTNGFGPNARIVLSFLFFFLLLLRLTPLNGGQFAILGSAIGGDLTRCLVRVAFSSPTWSLQVLRVSASSCFVFNVVISQACRSTW